MTHNQIEYWNLQENKRHNLASESETARHNVSTEGETNRHNLVTESTEIGKLGETIRHNVATEQESARHNRETENIGYGQLNETVRHNLASESIESMNAQIKKDQLAETVRHNKQQEIIDKTNATTNAVDRVTRASSSWISSGSSSAAKKAIGAGGIASTLRSLAKKPMSINPILVPKNILQPLHKSGMKGEVSA